MKSKRIKPALTFRQAVAATPDVAGGYREGLLALGANSKRIIVTETDKLQHSFGFNRRTSGFPKTPLNIFRSFRPE